MLLVGIYKSGCLLAGPVHRHVADELLIVKALLDVGLVKLEDDLLLELNVLALELFELRLGLDRKVLLGVLLMAHHGGLLLLVMLGHHVLVALVLDEGYQLLMLLLLLLLKYLLLLLGCLRSCRLDGPGWLCIGEWR